MTTGNRPAPGQAWDYGRYRIRSVFQRTTPEERAEIVAFWRRNSALPRGARPEDRARQVVLTAKSTEGALVGVNTVYMGRLHPAGPDYWFYRMFIQPADRVPGMMRIMTLRAFEVLRDAAIPNRPAGVIIMTENPKLMRRGMRAMIERGGWRHLGQSQQRQDIWLRRFPELR